MMLQTKGKPLMAAVLLLTSLGVTTSCIDNSYDLKKDIDMTINVGGEHLAIPVGYTEKITLDKIIELDEGDDLQIKNGEYHLLKKGTIENAKTDVQEVTVEGSTTNINPILAINTSIALIGGSIETPIDVKGNIKADAENIDKAVKSISELKAKNGVKLLLTLTLSGNFAYTAINTELKVTFPDFLLFEDNNNLENNVLTLNLTDTDLQKGIPYEYPLKLTGYKFEEGREIIDQKIEINDQVSIIGKSKVSFNNLGTGDLTITPVIVLANMEIASITGIVQPSIEAVNSTVNLENLPDFLQDNATELDIANPIFTFIANNPLEAPVTLNGTMLGKKGGNVIEGSTITIGKNSIDHQEIILKNGKNVIALSRLGTGGPEGSTNIKVSDINNLIKRIPEVVNVTLQPTVESDQYYTVNLGETYNMESSYDIDIPLNFGSNLKIVYEETITDFDLDLEDVVIKKAIIGITADNNIPLKMEITNDNVSALDKEGNKIAGIKVTVEGAIAEGKGDATVATSQLAINLDETQEGAINKLDGLSFKITAEPGQSTNVQLRSDQWMQLKNMKLKIPNGIKVDLN